MQRARKQQTCKQHRPNGPNPERGVTSSPCGQPTWGLVKYHGSRWGPRGPEWGDTWTCPCAPQGLAKAHVPHPAGRPKGKIQTLHLGGGIPREVRRRPLPVFRQNPKTAQKKNGRSSPYRGGTFWVSAFRLRTRDGRGFRFGSCAGQPGQQTFNGRYTISCRFVQNLHHLPATCLGVVRLTWANQQPVNIVSARRTPTA